MKQNIAYTISIFTLVMGFIIIAVLIFWSVYPYKILELKSGNAEIMNPEVYAGDFLKMHQINCKYKNLKSTINRQFVDSIIYQVLPTTTNRPLGCHDVYEYVFVPRGIPPGNYRIVTTISYQVNPIRTINYTVTTPEFTILEATQSAVNR